MSYNPLHDSLLTSSVLAEGPDVVSILALFIASADREGFSELTPKFCASALRISDERALEAFRILAAPDPHSRTKDHEGRRIVPVDGGWLLVSHGKWRLRASREAANERQARYTAKKKQAAEATGRCEAAEGCDGAVAGARDGIRVCSAHAFREPGQEG